MPSFFKKSPQKQQPDVEEVRRRRRGLVAWVLLGLALLWLWQSAIEGLTVTTIPYSEFKQHVQRAEVVEALIKADVIEGEIRPQPDDPSTDDAEEEPFRFRTVRVEDPNLVEELDGAGIEYVGERPTFLSQFLLAWFVPIGLIALLWVFLARRMQEAAGSALNLGRNKAKIVADNDTGVSFADVAGCDEAKAELQEVVEFLREPARYQALGAKIPKGVLLVGPPGTGKTLVARAVAGEAKVPFYQMSGSDFVEMFVGVGAARVRDLFEQATRHAPCIVFIDEIDAIGRTRGAHVGVVNDEREQTLNQLLVEMDGFDVRTTVILIAATNRPDILDPALLRPGRFDRQIPVDRPDLLGREAILDVHSRGKPFEDDVDIAVLARQTPGFTGADLANLVNEAALLSARYGKKTISMSELEESIERVIAGPERRTRLMSESEKRTVAYHESGHAIVGHALPNADPVHKITIIPRGQALGFTMQLPTEDKYLIARGELIDRLAVMLGGRVAEELKIGDITTGAGDDIRKATATAKEMVTQYGMSDILGPITLGHRDSQPFVGREMGGGPDYSGQVAAQIDEEIRKLLDEAHDEALEILVENDHVLESLATKLLEVETVDGALLDEVFDPIVKRPNRAIVAPGADDPASVIDQLRRLGRFLNGHGNGHGASNGSSEPRDRAATGSSDA
jgi:cell division protease FtsH